MDLLITHNIERLNQTIKRSSLACCDERKIEWDEILDEVVDLYNWKVHRTHGKTPYEVFHLRYENAANELSPSPTLQSMLLSAQKMESQVKKKN